MPAVNAGFFYWYNICHQYWVLYYLYLIASVTAGKYYIGQTSDLSSRPADHNSLRKKYSKGKGPWHLAGYRRFPTRADDLTEERRLIRAKN